MCLISTSNLSADRHIHIKNGANSRTVLQVSVVKLSVRETSDLCYKFTQSK